jgi:hypothetical protein
VRIAVLLKAVLVGLFIVGPVGATESSDQPPVVTDVPDGVVVTGTDGGNNPGNNSGGGGGGSSSQGCPGYESVLSVPAQGPQIGPDGGYYAWERWRCPPGGWNNRSVCVYLCPAGVPGIPVPDPPSNEQIQARLEQYVVRPLGRFAPPVESPTVKATVGMRFYYSVHPSTYQVIAPPAEAFPGGWLVTATLTPGKVSFIAGDKSSSCDGPGTSGRTEAGRNAANEEGCFVILETVSESGRLATTLTTEWTITVISTNFGSALGLTWTIPATTTYDIGLRELQAVIVK